MLTFPCSQKDFRQLTLSLISIWFPRVAQHLQSLCTFCWKVASSKALPHSTHRLCLKHFLIVPLATVGGIGSVSSILQWANWEQHNFTEIVSGWDACACLGNSKIDTPSGPHELSWEVDASDKWSLALCACIRQKVLNLFIRGNDWSERGSSKARKVSRTVQSQASVSTVSVPPP